MRRFQRCILLMAVACAADDGDVPFEVPAVPDCAVTFRGDPADPEPTAWPDDHLLVPDAASPWGWRLDFDTTVAPWSADIPGPVAPLVTAVDGRSGFGRLGAAWMRFTGELPWTEEALNSPDGPVHWLDVERGEEVPVEVFVDVELDGRHQLRVQPLRPLRPGAAHVVVLEADASGGSDASCVSPGAPLWNDLWAGTVDGTPIDWTTALDAGGWRPEDIGAGVHLTTHEDTAVIDEIAASLDDVAPPVVSKSCEDWVNFHRYLGVPVLMAFHAGSQAREFSERSDEEMSGLAMQALRAGYPAG